MRNKTREQILEQFLERIKELIKNLLEKLMLEERKWSCPALMDSLLLGRRNQNKSTVQAPKPPTPCDTRTPSAPAYMGFPCSTPW